MRNLLLLFISLSLLACGNNKEVVDDSEVENTEEKTNKVSSSGTLNIDLNNPNGNENSMPSDSILEIDVIPRYVEEIDAQVKDIKNKEASASAIMNMLENEDFCGATDQGCFLKATIFHDEIISFKTWYGFTNGYQEAYYYLNEGKLIKYEEYRYEWVYDEASGEFNYDETNKNFDGQYYFRSGKLIEQTTVGHNRFENDELDPQTTLLEETSTYKSLFQN